MCKDRLFSLYNPVLDSPLVIFANIIKSPVLDFPKESLQTEFNYTYSIYLMEIFADNCNSKN